jgi:hypothetical protein
MKKKLMLLSLSLLAASAQAEQTVSLQAMTGLSVTYAALQLPIIRVQDLVGPAAALKECWKVSPQEFFQREKLAINASVVGAFYCQQSGQSKIYVAVDQF